MPEIKAIPLEELVLQMKAMLIENVINFPFPTPPDPKEIRLAERKLITLGALQQPAKNLSLREMEKHMTQAKITPLGRAMSLFPLAPRFSKMLVLSGQNGNNFMQYTITMVAALSMQEVLIEVALGTEDIQPQNHSLVSKIRRTWAGTGNSLLLGDPMILIKAVGACEYAGYTQEFCEQNGLRYKAMVEIRKLRNQLTNKVNDIWPKLNVIMNPKMQPPSDQDTRLLRQIILSGSPDQIAKKVKEEDLKDASDKSKMKLAYKCGELEEPVFLKR
jgi:ATP-dependent RNA helicase DHX37/DHR1